MKNNELGSIIKIKNPNEHFSIYSILFKLVVIIRIKVERLESKIRLLYMKKHYPNDYKEVIRLYDQITSTFKTGPNL